MTHFCCPRRQPQRESAGGSRRKNLDFPSRSETLASKSLKKMGRGGDATAAKDRRRGQFIRRLRHSPSLERLKGRAEGLREDLTVLRSIWFHRSSNSTDHASRLESFYKPQAQACARSAPCLRPAASPAFASPSARINATVSGHRAFWLATMLTGCKGGRSAAGSRAVTLRLASSEYAVSHSVPADDRFRARFLHGEEGDARGRRGAPARPY